MNSELENELQALEAYLRDESCDPDQVINFVRDTSLPFIACDVETLGVSDAFDYSFKFLHLLGQYNLPLSVGLCMNQYIALSIASMPTAENTMIDMLKKQFLQQVKSNRWILAVSSFDDFVRNKNDKGNQVYCKTQEDGSVVCNGIKNFQSNITRADLLLFTGILDEEKVGLFYTLLQGIDGISFGEPMYPGAMADADTRAVEFSSLKLSPIQSIPSDTEDASAGLHALTRVVFASLAMAPYLGGARRALNEASIFLQNAHVDDKPLSELDGYIVDMGRAEIAYTCCLNSIERFSRSLPNLSRENITAWISEEQPKVLAQKHHVTGVCEDLVSLARKIVGTRSLLPSHIISGLTQQIVFGALHPEINAKIERDFGSQALSVI